MPIFSTPETTYRFIDEKAEAQRGSGTEPESPCWRVAELVLHLVPQHFTGLLVSRQDSQEPTFWTQLPQSLCAFHLQPSSVWG